MSTLKVISYDTSDQNKFVHDTDDILIDINGATFIKVPLSADGLYKATARIKANADQAKDNNISTFFIGTAFWDDINTKYDFSDTDSGNYMSLNNDSARDGITPLTPTSHFQIGQKGTLRIKVTFDYSGSPPALRYIFATGNTIVANGLGSLIELHHDVSGNMILGTRNEIGSGTINSNLGSFSPVAGTEYEFELDIDSSALNGKLFINGAILGSVSVVSVGANPTRDFFYFGTYYLSNFTSSIFIRDIEIFNSVQHSSDFTSEVPRVVNVYPLESGIGPTEFSTAEGFLDLSDDQSVSDGALVNYHMKIENTLYFISGGVLTTSDGSFAESSTVAEWVANKAVVDAFINTGARITMFPIPSSGEFGAGNFTLVSTSLTYDFFGIPDACIVCTLYGFVNDNCNDITSGTVRVFTTKPIHTQGVTSAFDDIVNIRLPDGFFEIELIIPNLPVVEGRTDDTYNIELKWTDAAGKKWQENKKIIIPNQATVLYDENIIQ